MARITSGSLDLKYLSEWIKAAQNNPLGFGIGMCALVMVSATGMMVGINEGQRFSAFVVMFLTLIVFAILAAWLHAKSNDSRVETLQTASATQLQRSEALAKEVASEVHKSLEGYVLNESRDQQIETWAVMIASIASKTDGEPSQTSRLRSAFANGLFSQIQTRNREIRDEVRLVVEEALDGASLLNVE